MKSPDPLDPCRLEVLTATTRIGDLGEAVILTVSFQYDPWEPSPAQDVLMEQSNAMQALRAVLAQGGMRHE